MKVLVISHMYPVPYNEAYGTFVHEQVKALVKKGVEVQVVSPSPWAPLPINYMNARWRSYSQAPRQRTWEGIDVHYPRYPAFPKNLFQASSGLRMYLGIKERVREIRRTFPFDIIHAHVPLPDGYAGMLLSNKFAVPLIVTVHGGTLYFIAKERKAGYNAMQRALKEAKTIVTVSEKNREILESLGLSDIHVVPNGIPLDLIQRLSTDRVKMLRDNIQSEYFLLGVGNLVPRKKFAIAIKAISKLILRGYDITYVIIGEGPERGRLLKVVKELGVEERIRILPRQDKLIKVYEYMKACDIFVLPSVMEGFGVVFAEAMALGKPVIGCEEGVVPGLVQNRRTGLLVLKDDVDSLVEALDFLLNHPDEAKAIGERARRLVLENYTWEMNAEKTIEIYKEVLNAQ